MPFLCNNKSFCLQRTGSHTERLRGNTTLILMKQGIYYSSSFSLPSLCTFTDSCRWEHNPFSVEVLLTCCTCITSFSCGFCERCFCLEGIDCWELEMFLELRIMVGQYAILFWNMGESSTVREFRAVMTGEARESFSLSGVAVDAGGLGLLRDGRRPKRE